MCQWLDIYVLNPFLFQTYLFTVNGGWGDWQPYGACTKTCGAGTRIRSRKCDNPLPSNGGLDCPGDSTQTSSCTEGPCPSKEFLIF